MCSERKPFVYFHKLSMHYLDEWGYSHDQEELNDWRYHIIKELARDRIIDHDGN